MSTKLLTWGLLGLLCVAVPGAASADGGERTGIAELPKLPELPSGPVVRKVDTKLEYVSDFFVFVGRETGLPEGSSAPHLLFAFDANRGREDKKFAAEHFAVLWLEGRGWVELRVTGDVPGAASQMEPVLWAELPDSDIVKVEGNAAAGLMVDVPGRRLQLRAEAVQFHTDRRRGADTFASASGAGELDFEGKTYRGVVHHELCYLGDINPLARTYTDLFGDGFHGVYGLVGDNRPLRLHRSGGRLEPLVGRRSGYGPAPADAASEKTNGQAVPPVTALPNFSFDTSKKSLAGFFRWPGRYESAWTWPGAAARSQLRVDLSDRETLINYVFGGVAIAVARGELKEGQRRESVFGFALIVL